MAALVADAPVLLDHLDAESKAHFEKLQALLDALGIEYTLIRAWYVAWIITIARYSNG